MKNLLYIFVILCFFSNLNGQNRPVFFPEEVDSQPAIGVRQFCKPGIRNKSRSKGVELSYLLRGNGKFKTDDQSFSSPPASFNKFEQLGVKVRIPVLNLEGFKLLLGYKYSTEVYDLDQIGPEFSTVFDDLNGKNLKNNSFDILMVKVLDENTYLAFRGGYKLSGDYNGWVDFDNKYSSYKATIVYGIKKNEDFEWGPGLAFSDGLRQARVLPFIILNKNFNHKWGIEAVLPASINFRYNLSRQSIILIGGQYNSESYQINMESLKGAELNYVLNHSEIIGLVQLEQKLANWVWMNFKLGYQENFNTEFNSQFAPNADFEVEPTNYFFFQIGLFLSPPR